MALWGSNHPHHYCWARDDRNIHTWAISMSSPTLFMDFFARVPKRTFSPFLEKCALLNFFVSSLGPEVKLPVPRVHEGPSLTQKTLSYHTGNTFFWSGGNVRFWLYFGEFLAVYGVQILKYATNGLKNSWRKAETYIEIENTIPRMPNQYGPIHLL